MKKTECDCEVCQLSCKRKPGWFKPDEIEQLAKNMKLTTKELFDKYLGVDWWVGGLDSDLDNIFVLTPSIKGVRGGAEYPADPRGTCIFYNRIGKCEIHTLGKPFECAIYHHDIKDMEYMDDIHKSVAKSWIKHQNMIIKLLGREPKTKKFDFIDFVSTLINGLGINYK